MDRKLKIVLIVLWSIIAVFLSGVLVYSINNEKNGGSIFSIFNGNAANLEIQKEESYSINNINNIKLDFASENISVYSTEDIDIKVIEKSSRKLKESQKFKSSIEENSLTLKEGKRFIVFGINQNRVLEVYIPKKYINNLNIDLSSGNVKINNDLTIKNIVVEQSSGNFNSLGIIKADKIDINGSSGNVSAKEINALEYNFQLSSGNIKIDTLSGSGYGKCTSGNIVIGLKDLLDYGQFTASSGNITFYISENLSFNFFGNCSSGNIKSDFPLNYKDKHTTESLIGTNSSKKLKAEVTSGNIYLYKNRLSH